jgi:hypothetical protein
LRKRERSSKSPQNHLGHQLGESGEVKELNQGVKGRSRDYILGRPNLSGGDTGLVQCKEDFQKGIGT